MNASPGVVVEATDDVDHLVDELMKDPSRAEDIKAVLKQRISKPQPVNFKTEPASIRSFVGDDNEEDDLWDNVPV